MIPSFLIFAGKVHLNDWYKQLFPRISNPALVITLTNNALGLKWIKHFDEFTRNRLVGTIVF